MNEIPWRIEQRWLARILVAALLIWMPLELLRGVIPAQTLYDMLKDQAFANVAQAVGALATVLAIVGTAYVARRQMQAAAEQTRQQIEAAAGTERERVKQARISFFMHVDYVMQLVDVIEDFVSKLHLDIFQSSFSPADCERAMKELDELRVGLIGDPLVRRVSSNLKTLFTALTDEVEKLRFIKGHAPLEPHTRDHAAWLVNALRKLRKDCQPFVDQLGN